MSSAPASPPALEISGLCAGYAGFLGLREHPVLIGIDLGLARGGILGLAGPNGSGKSTLLRLIAGIERPRAGRLSVLGGSPSSASVRARIGYLSEESPFPPELTARDALDLAGALQRLPRARAQAERERLLALVGLEAAARTRLGRYSRGMLRRFGLAQAWLHAPELLLLDEPTAGLDAQGFEVLERLLGEARARGASVVIASHLASDLLEHCQEVAVILGGRIARRGAPGELLAGGGLLGIYRAHAATQAGA